MDRKKCFEFLLLNGLKADDIKNIVLDLSVSDYFKGPEADHNGSEGEIWVFKPYFLGEKIYLKLKLVVDRVVICISIHD